MARFEMLFLIGAGLLFAKLLLTEHTANLSANETALSSKIALNAISIANSFVERVRSSSVAFDEYTITHAALPRTASLTDSVSLLAHLTYPPSRGPSETTLDLFDDVDDFHNYDDTVSVEGVGLYHVVCHVSYFDAFNGIPTNTRTWHKLFTVVVTDTVPGSDIHFLSFGGQQVAIRRSVVISYANFL